MIDAHIFITLLFLTLIISILSSLFFLIKKISPKYARIHIYIVVLPAIVASSGLILSQKNIEIGIWRSDVLSWLMVGFVLVIGVIIQRYCIRYLAGDKSYKKYFTLFTFTTTFASLAWLTADMRIMVISW